jgi:hypothetical protein
MPGCSRFFTGSSSRRTPSQRSARPGARRPTPFARYGTSGSRLHRADDGDLVAYAVWPDRATWEKAQTLPSASPESGAAMRACMVGPVTATPLEVLDDLLVVGAVAR